MKSFIPIFFIPLLFQISTANNEFPDICKGLNEEYSTCGSDCNLKCGENVEVCLDDCKIGCFCKAGYRRSHSGICVPEDKCDACPGENEFYNNCGSSCNEQCGEDNEMCNLMCQEGCFCIPGYKRTLDDGKCVPVTKCYNCTGENEEYTTCGSNCTESCDNNQADCTMECHTGCFCKIGFKRNSTTGNCVPENECPKSTEVHQCGPNEEFKCSNRCLEKIDDGTKAHCYKDTYFACFCCDGYARDPVSMKCVPETPSFYYYFIPVAWKQYCGF